MIRHIVLFNFRKDVTTEQVHNLNHNMANLKNKIPGIINFNSGNNVSSENLNKDFDYGFTMDFESENMLNDYLPHPEHQALLQEQILPLLQDGLNSAFVFDFEI